MSVPMNEPEVEFEDYFGFDDFHTFTLPDGKQWFKFKVMNEGDRAKFQRLTNKDIKINRTSQDAIIATDVAAERHMLITQSVVDWYMLARMEPGAAPQPVGFSLSAGKINLQVWLAKANPKIVDDLELAIRQANPWMQADMTTDEIDKEIQRLNELRDEVTKREASK
jgi:hypothetical protein